MSRREIPARQPGDTVFVGWDRPLQTFFAQVYKDGYSEDENPVVWVGADRPRELCGVNDLEQAVGPYAELTAAMRATLIGDKEQGR